jgi:hypothetical protein
MLVVQMGNIVTFTYVLTKDLDYIHPLHIVPPTSSPHFLNLTDFTVLFSYIHKVHPPHLPSFTLSVYLPPSRRFPALTKLFSLSVLHFFKCLFIVQNGFCHDISHMRTLYFSPISPHYYSIALFLVFLISLKYL